MGGDADNGYTDGEVESVQHEPERAAQTLRGRGRRAIRWFARGDALEWRGAGWVLAGLIVVGFILRVQAWTLFNGRFPIEGDLVAQNWWLTEFRSRLGELLTGGHLFGWTDDFGAGQPFGYFYFPLPAAIFSVLSIGVGGAVAVKLLQFGAFVIVPYGLWRGLGLCNVSRTSRILAVGVVAAGSFFPHRYPVGGDLWSVMIGEYSYSWSLGFTLWLLGALYALPQGRLGWRTVAFLGAAVVLSHANVAFVAAPIALLVVVVGGVASWWTRRRVNIGGVAAVVVSVVGLCAFWLMPMRTMYANVQGNNKIRPEPLSFWFTDGVWVAVAVVGIGGLVLGMLRLRPSAWYFAGIGGAGAVIYEILTEHPEFDLWAGRAMPFVYLALLGGAAELFATLIAWAPRRAGAWVAAVVVSIGAGWVAWSQSEAYSVAGGEIAHRIERSWKGAGHGEAGPRERVDALIDALGRLEPGRVFYATAEESHLVYGAGDLNGEIQRRLGGPGGASTFFHEANRGRGALSYAHSGLVSTPSVIEPGWVGMGLDDFDVAIEMLRQFGVRYYIVGDEVLSELADNNPRLARVAAIGEVSGGTNTYFEVYEIEGSAVVEAVKREPGISQTLPLWGESTWNGKVREWLKRLDADVFEGVYLVESAPLEVDWTGRATYEPVEVSNVVVDDEAVQFSVDRLGVPIVIRMGYTEQWVAVGAEGPYHVAPHGMIVVPTQHDVELHFIHPDAERQGLIISLCTFVLIGLSWRSARRRSTRTSDVEKRNHLDE